MFNLLIAGSIGIDNIETPFGKKEGLLGGSGIYASLAASFFASPALVSIAGKDLSTKHLKLLKLFSVDVENVVFKDKTFRWSGEYKFDMNEAKTLKTELNSLASFNPRLNQTAKQADFLLLGNTDPVVQLKILDQMQNKPFVAVDTMNYWITSAKNILLEVIKRADLMVLNEGEARQLFNTPNLIKAGHLLLECGPKYAIIKKGEHGALLFSKDEIFAVPGYPLEQVADPTGCGDSFVGGMVGLLVGQQVSKSASQQVSKEADQQVSGSEGQELHGQTAEINFEKLKKAVVYGSIIASFCAEEFGVNYREYITLNDIENRYSIMKRICKF